MLSKFSKREQSMVIMTVAITAATLSYVFIVEPIMEAYATIDRKIKTYTVKIQKGQSLLMREEVILAQYKKYADLIRPALTDEEEIAAMLKVIEEIASQNQIQITNIRPQPVREGEFYKELIFELSAESDVRQLGKFIYEIQGSGNILRVKRLIMTSSVRPKQPLKVTMEISKPAIASAQ
jgi:Tfp pilus assembly protein PilO